jgi:trehalose 6-phosphate phosphatase
MKELLSPRHRRALDRLLAAGGPPPLLAFDYDGVLAPLIPDPRGAPMSRRTRALLAALAERAPVAVVSGRSFAKLHRVVGGVAPFLVGNHGHEHLHATPVPPEIVAAVRRWEAQLAAEVAEVAGVHVEHKRSTFAVHWAQARDRGRAGRAVLRAARRLEGVRLVPGKNLVNVLPAAFPTKGDAVRRLLGELGCRRALFVGDDVTDEDVFALPRRLVLGVHVGPGPSRAPWRIPDRAGVDLLLERLVALTGARPGPGRRSSTLRAVAGEGK